MLCITALTTCCVSENITLTQILAHYLQQPCQDRRRVAIEKKACHVFPAKHCHFHNVVRVSMSFLYNINCLVYSFCLIWYLWNSVSSCFCSAAIPLLIKSITWRHSIKKVNGMAKKSGYMSSKREIVFKWQKATPHFAFELESIFLTYVEKILTKFSRIFGSSKVRIKPTAPNKAAFGTVTCIMHICMCALHWTIELGI